MPYVIGILVPDAEFNKLCQQIADEISDTIFICREAFYKDIRPVLKAEERGIEVIICTGSIAPIIRKQVTIPVVEMMTTDQDLLKALHIASQCADKIAVVATRLLLSRQDLIEELLQTKIKQFVFKNCDYLLQVLRTVKKENYQMVVGELACVHAAATVGLKGVAIKNSKQAIIYAITEARNVAETRRKKHYRSQYVQAIMNFAQEGIIAIDNNLTITAYNKVAQSIFKIEADKIIGQRITKVIPNTKLDRVLVTGKSDFGDLKKVGQSTYIAINRVPIQIDDKIVGAVATFKDVTSLQEAEQKIRNKFLASGHIAKYRITDIIGRNSELLRIKQDAARYARSDLTILMIGESGTGKEMFAQSIHNLSMRKKGPFVAVNCAAIPEKLMESELFGYEEGAFTGARGGGKPGLFWLAHGGTMFLDEIESIPPPMQARLLRVLQESEITPIGSNKVIPIDVRIIATASMNLKHFVDEGKFRPDLFYRLNVLTLVIPPLRTRKDDILLLASRFLSALWPDQSKATISISKKAAEALLAHNWPGNIRELENIMERIAVFARQDKEVRLEHVKKSMADIFHCPVPEPYIRIEMKGTWGDIKLQIINKVLETFGGNQTEAAKKLGISRTQLWRIIKKRL